MIDCELSSPVLTPTCQFREILPPDPSMAEKIKMAEKFKMAEA